MKYLLFIGVFIATTAQAASGIIYEGRLIKPDTNPLEANPVSLKIQLRSPGGENCLMWEETHSIDMTGSNGFFSVTIGNGSGARSSPGVDGGHSLEKVLANRGTLSYPSCGSYSPTASAGRKIVMEFNDGSGPELLPAMALAPAPQAIEASQVSGYDKDQLLRVADGTVATELSNANWTELWNLITGASSLYARNDGSGFSPTASVDYSGQKIINLATPTAAQDAATKNYVDTQLGGKLLDPAGVSNVAGNGRTLIWDQAQDKFVTGIPIDSTKLPLSGGALTGTLDMGSNDILNVSNLSLANQGTLHLGALTSIQETVMTGGFGPADEGRTWFNTTSNKMKYWDGLAPQEVGTTSLGYTPVDKNGDTMTGLLVLSADPSAATGAATKQYVDAVATASSGTYVRFDGTTPLSADWDLNGATAGGTSLLTGLGTPTVADGAATKGYADANLLGNAITAPVAGNVNQSIRWNAAGTAWEYYTPSASIAADSLNFTDLSDSLVLDAVTSITAPSGQSYSLSIVNEGTGNSFSVSDQLADASPFVIDVSGNVGIGTGSPNQLLTVNGSMSLAAVAAPSATAGFGKIYVDSGDSNKLKYMNPSGVVTDLTAVGGGTVTSVTSANADIAVGGTAAAPVLTLNSGIGNNQIVKLDGLAKLPAVDGSQLMFLNASSITSGTISDSHLSPNILRANGAFPMTGALNMNSQPVMGSSVANGNLILESTSNATKGAIVLKNKASIMEGASVNAYGVPSILEIYRANGTEGSPFAVNSADVIGRLSAKAHNGIGVGAGAHIQMVAASNWSSGFHPTDMIFATASGSSPVEQMRITSGGNIGIGTTNPSNKFHVVAAGGSGSVFEQGSPGQPSLLVSNTSGPDAFITSEFSDNLRIAAPGGRDLILGSASSSVRLDSAIVHSFGFDHSAGTTVMHNNKAVVRLTAASPTVNCIEPGVDGQRLTLINTAAGSMTLSHMSVCGGDHPIISSDSNPITIKVVDLVSDGGMWYPIGR